MKQFKKIIAWILGCFMILTGVACGGKGETDWYYQKTTMKTDGQLYTGSDVSLPDTLWQTPEAERYTALDKDAAKGYFIKSVQDTWVFCFVGIPESATAENPAPGMVLIHGGAGTAYQQWVNFWVNRGYAAIAMDTEGLMPTEESFMNNGNRTVSIKSPRGPINGGFDDVHKPIEEMWVYHAIAATIVSNSFLRSFEEVDSNKIGVTGISYGSFLTWQAVAYDDRYLFAAPVYGSPCQAGTDTTWGTRMEGKTGALWDDVSILEDNSTPILYFNSNIDTFFSIEATTMAVQSGKNCYMTLRHNFLHGHDLGGLQVDEIYAFADAFCKDGAGLIKIKKNAENGTFDPQIQVETPKDVTIKQAIAFYATTDVLNNKTSWSTVVCDVEGDTITASLPGNAVSYYINVIDDRNLEVSTHVCYTYDI